MKRTFINQQGQSNKFWTIELADKSYVINFGKVGTKGRANLKELTDKDTCYKEAEKLIADKQRNGYKELSEGQTIPDKIEPSYRAMDEDIFWDIIALFNWKKTGDDVAVLKPALKRLVSMTVNDIKQFAEILAEKLYQLDGVEYASNIGPDSYQGENKPFSVDYFLYVRCCVVANGKDYYYNVLEHPVEMPKEIDFEALLYLADEAYNIKIKTEGENIDTKLSFETFSNVQRWQTQV